MSDRTFRLILDSKKGGLVKGSSPSSAAKKVGFYTNSVKTGKSSIKFELQETTKGSKKKIYGPYKTKVKMAGGRPKGQQMANLNLYDAQPIYEKSLNTTLNPLKNSKPYSNLPRQQHEIFSNFEEKKQEINSNLITRPEKLKILRQKKANLEIEEKQNNMKNIDKTKKIFNNRNNIDKEIKKLTDFNDIDSNLNKLLEDYNRSNATQENKNKFRNKVLEIKSPLYKLKSKIIYPNIWNQFDRDNIHNSNLSGLQEYLNNLRELLNKPLPHINNKSIITNKNLINKIKDTEKKIKVIQNNINLKARTNEKGQQISALYNKVPETKNRKFPFNTGHNSLPTVSNVQKNTRFGNAQQRASQKAKSLQRKAARNAKSPPFNNNS
jgi:hypothetical protein